MEWPIDKLSRFEAARLIGARSLQVALGAPILGKSDDNSPLAIAKVEFRNQLIPMTIKRKLPNGTYQILNLKKALTDWVAAKGDEI